MQKDMHPQEAGPHLRADLKALRRAFGLSQQELADHLGFNRTQLSMAESGARSLSRPMVAKLASFYCVDPLLLQAGVGLLPDGLPADFAAPALSPQVAHEVAHFFLLVRNYQKMDRILAASHE